MFDAIQFLQELTEEDKDWIFEVGSELQVISGAVVVKQGEPLNSLTFVLQGLLVASFDEYPTITLARMGPGELVGELSYLESQPASATVRAQENSLLLSINTSVLEEKFEIDVGFSSRFFRALAKMEARRLRGNSSRLGALTFRAEEITSESDEYWGPIEALLSAFKAYYFETDQATLQNHGVVPQERSDDFLQRYREFIEKIEGLLGEDCGLDRAVRDHLGQRLQTEFLPYVQMSASGDRAYSKPRGYAGDFQTIEWVYTNIPEGVGRLGQMVDRAILSMPTCEAVRNRRKLLATEIRRAVETRGGDSVEITSLASGPAREIYDLYLNPEMGTRVQSHLIDIDPQALAFVSDWRNQMNLQGAISLHNLNLVYLALGKEKLDLPPQDLIYSIGLIDYFDDKFVVMLLNYIHRMLRPGGRVVLGNFHTSNRCRAVMDYVFDWKLIHRNEEEMNHLFSVSDFGAPCSEILFEEQGINLFACGEKSS